MRRYIATGTTFGIIYCVVHGDFDLSIMAAAAVIGALAGLVGGVLCQASGSTQPADHKRLP